MNSILKTVLVASTGLLAGAVGGYFLAIKKLEGMYLDRVTADAEAYRAYLDDKYAREADLKKKSGSESPTGAKKKEEMSHVETSSEDSGCNRDYSAPYRDKPDLAEFARRVRDPDLDKHMAARTGPEDDEPEEEEFIIGPDGENYVPREPGIHVISVDEFDDFPHYEKISLTYYEEDNVLADDHDEVIEDPAHIIGPRALQNFGYLSGDSNIVYVRNPDVETDFEILKVNSSYEEEVLERGT